MKQIRSDYFARDEFSDPFTNNLKFLNCHRCRNKERISPCLTTSTSGTTSASSDPAVTAFMAAVTACLTTFTSVSIDSAVVILILLSNISTVK